MPDNLKWKKGLLSSGMPLEFEAASILVSKGFAVNSDFKYTEVNDFGVVKDSSVALHASSDTPFSDSDKTAAHIDLLASCRHRRPDAAWLFMPDLNKPDFSPATRGNTIRVIDNFSPYTIESDAAITFDTDLPVCQKGIEIDLETGDSSDSVFRQGLVQLQYAIPRLLTENALLYLSLLPEQNLPFIFCPILLTTAQLFVINKDTTTDQIEACSEIHDIAAQVPYLIMYSDYGPDFEAQCIRECRRLKVLQKSDKAMAVEQKRARHYKSQHNLPFTIIEALTSGDRYYLNTFFTQFIICSNKNFQTLVDAIKKTAESALRTQKYIE
ncbi:MAG: hypothetical protein GY795_35445 [Desulfobacterales bacterium]|nr:hypothetical protein [Desulfobacterales bacterium]